MPACSDCIGQALNVFVQCRRCLCALQRVCSAWRPSRSLLSQQWRQQQQSQRRSARGAYGNCNCAGTQVGGWGCGLPAPFGLWWFEQLEGRGWHPRLGGCSLFQVRVPTATQSAAAPGPTCQPTGGSSRGGGGEAATSRAQEAHTAAAAALALHVFGDGAEGAEGVQASERQPHATGVGSCSVAVFCQCLQTRTLC